MVKNLPVNSGDMRDVGSIPESGRFLGEGNGNLPIFLPGKSHGQRNLVGYSPEGRRVRHDSHSQSQQPSRENRIS